MGARKASGLWRSASRSMRNLTPSNPPFWWRRRTLSSCGRTCPSASSGAFGICRTRRRYSVTIDEEKQQIVLRTSNKKYFKRIDVPDLKRVEPVLSLEDERLSWDYKHNTVVISYQRPAAIAKAEAAAIRAAEQNSQGLV